MTLKEAYINQYKKCIEKKLPVEMGGHYQTKITFSNQSVYVSPDGGDIERYAFRITGCVKKRVIKQKKLYFRKEKLPVFGTISRNKTYKKFLYKYILFLRCDGIESPDLILVYALHCMYSKFEYWRKIKKVSNDLNGKQITTYDGWEMYEPDYAYIEKMLDGLIQSGSKKEIDAKTREQFRILTRCVVNPETEGHRKKTRKEIFRDAHKGCKSATDNKIRSQYDQSLSDKENASVIGVSVRRLQEWKKDNVESMEDKIKRLYDPKLSLRKNADHIGCSVNTIRKYMVKETEEPDWIDMAISKDDIYGSAPTAKTKIDDELQELLDELDLDF